MLRARRGDRENNHLSRYCVHQHQKALSLNDGGDQGFLAAFFASRNVAWYELPRRYHLGWCVQPDEVQEAYIWHPFRRIRSRMRSKRG